MANVVRAINVGLILTINDLSFIPMGHMSWKYVQWIRSTISVAANLNLHFLIDRRDND